MQRWYFEGTSVPIPLPLLFILFPTTVADNRSTSRKERSVKLVLCCTVSFPVCRYEHDHVVFACIKTKVYG